MIVAREVARGTNLLFQEMGGMLSLGRAGGAAREKEETEDAGFGVRIVPLDVPFQVYGCGCRRHGDG